MAKRTVVLDEQEQTRLEQIVIDGDAERALEFARDLRRRLSRPAQCRPSELRTAGRVEAAIKKDSKG